MQDRFDCERFDSWVEKSQTLAFIHQCCKTSCTFLAVVRFKAALVSQATGLANFTIHSAFPTYIKYLKSLLIHVLRKKKKIGAVLCLNKHFAVWVSHSFFFSMLAWAKKVV